MSLSQVHAGLANTAVLFIAAIGIWALFLRFRSKPLSGNWYGAAAVGEILLVVQALLGFFLYLQGLGGQLPRPMLHILYGIVAIITLPAAYFYFGNSDDEKVKALAMALVCFFLWGIVLRAAYVARFLPTSP